MVIRRLEHGPIPAQDAPDDARKCACGVVTCRIGIEPSHCAGRIAPVQAEDPKARLVGAPLVVVDQGPVQVGRDRSFLLCGRDQRGEVLPEKARTIPAVGAGNGPAAHHPGGHAVLHHP